MEGPPQLDADQWVDSYGDALFRFALARVGETLHVHLREPDVLDRVCRIALDELPCDWAALYLLDEADGSYRQRLPANPDTPHSQLLQIARAEAQHREATRLKRRLVRGLHRGNLADGPEGD